MEVRGSEEEEEVIWGQRLEGPTLVVEEEATSQGVQAATGNQGRTETDASLRASRRNRPCGHLDLAQ